MYYSRCCCCFFYITERISSDNYSGTLYNFIGVVFEIPGAHPRPLMYWGSRGVLIRAVHLKFSKEKFWSEFRWREKSFFSVLSDTAEGPFTTVCLITRPARRLSVDNRPTIGRFHKILARINSLIDFEWPWMSQVLGKTNLLTCEERNRKLLVTQVSL